MGFFDLDWFNGFNEFIKTESSVFDSNKNYYQKIPEEGYKKIEDLNDLNIGDYYYEGYINFSPPLICNITTLNINDNTPNIKMDGIVLTCAGNDSDNYNDNLKRYAQPNETYYDIREKEKIEELIGKNFSNNGFLGPGGNLNNKQVNALIGKIENKNIFIPLKITPWTLPGNLLNYNNYIQIMVGESSNFAMAKAMYKEALKLIAYLLKYHDKEKLTPVSSGESTENDESIFITTDNEIFSFKENYSIRLSDSIKQYYNNIFNQSVEDFFLEDLNQVCSAIRLSSGESLNSDSPVKDFKQTINKKNYYNLKSKTIIIEKKSGNDNDGWMNKISFSTLIPLIKKVYMQLTGEGIQFYNELLYPKEDIKYFLTNNITKWNMLDSGLLSSLSFSDINELKAGLINQKVINNDAQTIITNTEISSVPEKTYNKNYLIYPTEIMCFSRYTHDSAHSDYPWDETGKGDEDRSYFYCPCDEMYVARISYRTKGNDASPNVVWLTSANKVVMANGEEDIVSIMIMHGEDEDIAKLSQGQVFYRKDPVILEGRTGKASNYHFHLSVGTGNIIDGGWQPGWGPPNGSLTVSGKCLQPNEAFFVDPNFTTEIWNSEGLTFKELKEEQYEQYRYIY